MRAFFLLLVLANLAFFAWAHYLARPDSGSDPLPITRQIDPQKLPIVSPPLKPAPPAAVPTPAAAPAPASASAPCIEWGSFTVANLPAARKLLEPLVLGARLGERQVDETANWWVYIAPQGSRDGAQRKAAELKGSGSTTPSWCRTRGATAGQSRSGYSAARRRRGRALRCCSPRV